MDKLLKKNQIDIEEEFKNSPSNITVI